MTTPIPELHNTPSEKEIQAEAVQDLLTMGFSPEEVDTLLEIMSERLEYSEVGQRISELNNVYVAIALIPDDSGNIVTGEDGQPLHQTCLVLPGYHDINPEERGGVCTNLSNKFLLHGLSEGLYANKEVAIRLHMGATDNFFSSRHRLPDGTERTAHVYLSISPIDEDGQPLFDRGVIFDPALGRVIRVQRNQYRHDVTYNVKELSMNNLHLFAPLRAFPTEAEQKFTTLTSSTSLESWVLGISHNGKYIYSIMPRIYESPDKTSRFPVYFMSLLDINGKQASIIYYSPLDDQLKVPQLGEKPVEESVVQEVSEILNLLYQKTVVVDPSEIFEPTERKIKIPRGALPLGNK